MNIFATSPSPILSAVALDDKRVNKMIIESAQLICGAVGGPFLPHNKKHPAQIWVEANPDHLRWLFKHFYALGAEYERRFNKQHGCIAKMSSVLPPRSGNSPSTFYNGARRASLNIDFTHIPDTHDAYRQYLSARWNAAYAASVEQSKPHLAPKWTHTLAPKWFTKVHHHVNT